MTLLRNSAEGQVSGTVVSDGSNTGGTSGDAFTASIAGSNTITFDSAHAAHGTRGYKLTGPTAASNAQLRYDSGLTASPRMAARFYIYLTAYPTSAVVQVMQFLTAASGQVCILRIANTTGLMSVSDSSAATITLLNFSTPLPLNTWVRVEMKADIGSTAGTGTIDVAFYPADSGTATESHSATGVALGTTNIARVRYGKGGTGVLADTWFDDLAAEDTRTTFLGVPTDPIITTATATSARIPTNWPVGIHGSATGGTGTFTYAWTQVSGPSGSFGSTSAAETTWTPTQAGTAVLRLTVSDTSGSDSEDVTITSEAALAFTAVTASAFTATGGTATAVLADTSDATFITSPANPTSQTVDMTLPPLAEPDPDDLVIALRCTEIDASSSSIVATLRDGATVVATAATKVAPESLDTIICTFTQASIAAVTGVKWAAGTLVVRLSVTAAA